MDDLDMSDGELDVLNMCEALSVEGLSESEILSATDRCISPEEAVQEHCERVRKHFREHYNRYKEKCIKWYMKELGMTRKEAEIRYEKDYPKPKPLRTVEDYA